MEKTSRLNFPGDDKRLGNEKCPRVYMFPYWPKLGLLMSATCARTVQGLGYSKGSTSICVIWFKHPKMASWHCYSCVSSDTRSSKFQFTRKKKTFGEELLGFAVNGSKYDINKVSYKTYHRFSSMITLAIQSWLGARFVNLQTSMFKTFKLQYARLANARESGGVREKKIVNSR